MTYTTALGWTPVYQIDKDGDDITDAFLDRVTGITICSYEGGGQSDTADIDVDDRDWSVVEPSIGEGSATLSISLGYKENALYEMGTFQVDEIHHKWSPKTMTLHANSLGANTDAKAPAVIAYDGKTLGDIVNSIAQAAGFEAVVDPSLASIQIPYLNQRSSHQHLLQELERRFNGLAKFTDGKLSFTQRGTGLTASGQPLDTVTLGPEDISKADIQANNYEAYTKVRASYIDRNTNQQVWVSSNISGNPNSSVPHSISRPYPSQAEAQAAANAAMAEQNRSSKQGKITLAKGDASIRGGSKVIIAGCRSGVDDTFMVRCATHTMTKDAGLTTELDLYTQDDSGSDAGSSTGDGTTTSTTEKSIGAGGIGHQ